MTHDTEPCDPPEHIEHGYVRHVDVEERILIVELPKAAPLPSIDDELELRWLAGEAAE